MRLDWTDKPIDEISIAEIEFGGLKSKFDRSLVYLLSRIDWFAKVGEQFIETLAGETWRGLEKYGIDIQDFKQRCSKGLMPREILFCFNAYPVKEKHPSWDNDYNWLRAVRMDDGFIESKEGLTTSLTRGNLDQHLRKLVKMHNLTKTGSRYRFNESARDNPLGLDMIKDEILKAKEEESWTNNMFTLIGLTTGKRGFKKTNQEIIEFVQSQFTEPTQEMCRRFLGLPENTIWISGDGKWAYTDDGKKKRRGKREMGQYNDRLPLIVIDPNYCFNSRSSKFIQIFQERIENGTLYDREEWNQDDKVANDVT